MFDVKQKDNENARREEIKALFREFLVGEGKIPAGFSEAYNRITASGHVRQGTPFDAYLDEIWNQVDSLNDRSGISDWLFFDGSMDLNAAVEIIAGWARAHREMNSLLRAKCRVGNTTIFAPVSLYCTGKVMIAMHCGGAPRNMSAEAVQLCKAENVSFCAVLSDRRLYDLVEQQEKEVQYATYPNYHDETYADWWLG